LCVKERVQNEEFYSCLCVSDMQCVC